MPNQETVRNPFVSYLISTVEADKRGVLADLRRGLGQPPGAAVQMYRYLVPWLPKTPDRNKENAIFQVAALFASHPANIDTGNLGDHLGQTLSDTTNDAVERRFIALLSAHEEDLADYLRQTISYLKSKTAAVNWSQLLLDIENWGAPDRRVQKAWARSFWSKSTSNHQTTNPTEETSN